MLENKPYTEVQWDWISEINNCGHRYMDGTIVPQSLHKYIGWYVDFSNNKLVKAILWNRYYDDIDREYNQWLKSLKKK